MSRRRPFSTFISFFFCCFSHFSALNCSPVINCRHHHHHHHHHHGNGRKKRHKRKILLHDLDEQVVKVVATQCRQQFRIFISLFFYCFEIARAKCLLFYSHNDNFYFNCCWCNRKFIEALTEENSSRNE